MALLRKRLLQQVLHPRQSLFPTPHLAHKGTPTDEFVGLSRSAFIVQMRKREWRWYKPRTWRDRWLELWRFSTPGAAHDFIVESVENDRRMFATPTKYRIVEREIV